MPFAASSRERGIAPRPIDSQKSLTFFDAALWRTKRSSSEGEPLVMAVREVWKA